MKNPYFDQLRLHNLKIGAVVVLAVIAVKFLTYDKPDYTAYELDPVQIATELDSQCENPKDILLDCCRFATIQNEASNCIRYTSDILPQYLYHFDHWSETGGIQEEDAALNIDYVTTEGKRVVLTYTPKGLLRCVVGLNIGQRTMEYVGNYAEEASLTRDEKMAELQKAAARKQLFLVDDSANPVCGISHDIAVVKDLGSTRFWYVPAGSTPEQGLQNGPVYHVTGNDPPEQDFSNLEPAESDALILETASICVGDRPDDCFRLCTKTAIFDNYCLIHE